MGRATAEDTRRRHVASGLVALVLAVAVLRPTASRAQTPQAPASSASAPVIAAPPAAAPPTASAFQPTVEPTPPAPPAVVEAAPLAPMPSIVPEVRIVRPDQARGLETPPPTLPADIGLTAPRVLLFPLRLVVKAIAFPLREGAIFVEKRALIPRVDRLLYNDAHTAAVLPTFQFLSSQGPSVGVEAFHADLFGHAEKVEGSAQLGGLYSQAYELSFRADRTGGSRLYLDTVGRFEIRPRLLFQGIGDEPRSTFPAGTLAGPRDVAVQTRYGENRLLVAQRAGYTIGEPGNLAKLGGAAIFNQRSFDDPTATSFNLFDGSTNTPTRTVYDTRQIVGFEETVRTLELSATMLVDTRDKEGGTSRGTYFDAFGGGVLPLGKYRYFHYGFDAATFFDLYRGNRVLVVRAAIDAVEGDTADIPFTDLPRLGGPNRLRGYRLDRFRDEKAAFATLEYRYPIHEIVSGALFVDSGHVDDDYRGLVDLRTWRVGGGAGLRVHSSGKDLFSLDVAYGDGVRLFFTTTPLRAFQNRERQL